VAVVNARHKHGDDEVARLAESIEIEMTDAVAELIFVQSALRAFPVWEEPADPTGRLEQAPLRISAGNRWLGGWTRSEWKQRMVGPESQAFTRLVQDWVVAAFTRWDVTHRPALAALLGATPNYDLFGDLRLLRNDIVHHNGIATSGNSGRCVLLKWFAEGEAMRMTLELLAQLLDLLQEWVRSLGGIPRELPAVPRPALED